MITQLWSGEETSEAAWVLRGGLHLERVVSVGVRYFL